MNNAADNEYEVDEAAAIGAATMEAATMKKRSHDNDAVTTRGWRHGVNEAETVDRRRAGVRGGAGM